MPTSLISRSPGSSALNENNLPLSRTVPLKTHAVASSSLVILDARVDRLPMLLADVGADNEVIVLDPQQDGIEQITAALSRYPQLTRVHLVSHGSPGQLFLGNSQLGLATMEGYAEQLRVWATALQGCELSIYGCQVAKGVSGNLFLRQLHQLTGASIAASARRVGRSDDWAQWELETQIGTVTTPVIFSQELQSLYRGSFEVEIEVEFSMTTFVEELEVGGLAPVLTITFTAGAGFVPGAPVVNFGASEPGGLARFVLPGATFDGLTAELVDPATFTDATLTLFAPVSQIIIPLSIAAGDAPAPGDIPGQTEMVDFTFTSLTSGVTVSPAVITSTFFESQEDFEASLNAPPIAVDDSATTDEDVAVVIDVLANDSDPDAGDVLSVETATDGANGTVTINGDGTITYTPNAGFSGTDSFTYTIGDLDGETATATVNITIALVDDEAPVVADAQGFSYIEGQVEDFVIGTLAATDDVGVTEFAIASGNEGGFFAISDGGVLTLTAAGVSAAANDTGIAPNSFVLGVTASDAAGNTSPVTEVSIFVVEDIEAQLGTPTLAAIDDLAQALGSDLSADLNNPNLTDLALSASGVTIFSRLADAIAADSEVAMGAIAGALELTI